MERNTHIYVQKPDQIFHKVSSESHPCKGEVKKIMNVNVKISHICKLNITYTDPNFFFTEFYNIESNFNYIF